jgi:cell division septation protein DedD
MYKLVGLVLLIFSIYSCGTSGKLVKDDTGTKAKEKSGKYDETFDPLSLDDDDIVVTKKEEPVSEQKPKENTQKESGNEHIALLESEGFRVQIFATRSIETATLAQQKAVDQFSDSGYKVYLVFEAPLYRIRIGDAVSRSDAEDIRDLAKERGYDEAFIVRSKIMVPETAASDISE